MDIRLFHLIATVIDACDQQPSHGPGHPPTETIRVVVALRRFLREGTPWRSLTATPDQASGSTLRRCLRRWAERGLLAKVHALLAAMLRGHPDLILDTCSVRAKRGGDLTGPNPTAASEAANTTSQPMGTAYRSPASRRRPISTTHLSSSGCSWLPLRLWPVSGLCSRTKATTPNATASYAAPLLPSPASTSAVNHADQGWESTAGRSSAAMPGYLRTDAWRCATIASASLSSPCCRPPVYSWLQAASPANSENRVLITEQLAARNTGRVSSRLRPHRAIKMRRGSRDQLGMQLGSIWGHGGYVAPDWSADWLYREAVACSMGRRKPSSARPVTCNSQTNRKHRCRAV